MANTSSNNISKISLLLEVHIANLANQTDADTSTDDSQIDKKPTVHEPETKQLDFLFHKATEVLQNVFLKNFSCVQDHNVVGLLELILLLIKSTQSAYSIGVKVLYHVLNLLPKREGRGESIERACMLTVLVAVTSNKETQSRTSICAIVIQHEGFMSYLQCCLDHTEADVMYCMACDLLVAVIREKNLKCDKAVQVDILKVVNSVCKDSADRQVASINLLSALFSVNLTNGVVKLTGRIYPAMYRSLYIQLQQSCLTEGNEAAYSAVNCMRNLILYLYQSEKDIGDELLSQPWNTVLLDIVLDLGSSGGVMEHQLCLLSMFTEFETSCDLIKTTSYLPDKLMKFVQLTRNTADKSLRGQYITLLKQLRTNFEDVLSGNLEPLKGNES